VTYEQGAMAVELAPADLDRLHEALGAALIMVSETVYRGHTNRLEYDWARGQLTDVMALLGHSSLEAK
jgi:hypothetical protein